MGRQACGCSCPLARCSSTHPPSVRPSVRPPIYLFGIYRPDCLWLGGARCLPLSVCCFQGSRGSGLDTQGGRMDSRGRWGHQMEGGRRKYGLDAPPEESYGEGKVGGMSMGAGRAPAPFLPCALLTLARVPWGLWL